MEKYEFRVLIKHYFLRKKTLSETKAKLDKYYSNSAPSYRMVQKWFTEFLCHRTSTETIPNPDRPNEITKPEIINKIHVIILNDPKVKVREISEIVSISTERVVNILHTHLCIRKLSAKWVPQLLTIDQKHIRVTTSEQNLAYFNCNLKEFLHRFVTMDETWIHHYTPKSGEVLKQWVKPGESAPKRLKTQQSAGKVLASVFWDAHGVIFIDYFQKGSIISGAYYAALLDRLVDEIRKKRPHLKKKILFHDNNAPSHTSNITQAKKHELRFESRPHPPYSPDPDPSDYYLFLNLIKRWMCGRHRKVERLLNTLYRAKRRVH